MRVLLRTLLHLGFHGVRHKISRKYISWVSYLIHKQERLDRALEDLKKMGIGC